MIKKRNLHKKGVNSLYKGHEMGEINKNSVNEEELV